MGRLQAGEEEKRRRGRGGENFWSGGQGEGRAGRKRHYKYIVTIPV